MAASTLRVRLVSPAEIVFEGEAIGVVAPAFDGKVGILRGHAPFITLLGGGPLDIDLPGGGSERFFVVRGVMKVKDDDVTLLTEYAGRKAPPDFEPRSAWLEAPDLEEISEPGDPLV